MKPRLRAIFLRFYLFTLFSKELVPEMIQLVVVTIGAANPIHLPYLSGEGILKNKRAISGLYFFIFVFLIQLTENKCSIEILPMTGFEPRTSSVGRNSSTN